MASLWDLLKDIYPDDHARQIDWYYYIDELMTSRHPPSVVVDLGCGDGKSEARFRRYDPRITWIGVELASSEYARPVGCSNVVFFDGVSLPFADDSVPVFFSNQVFEHVRHPEPLLREVRRALMPGGLLIGKTSHLEAYHAHSLWNFTPYGFRVIVEDAGLILEEVRPGIDGLALFTRSATRDKFVESWWTNSPHNREIDASGRASRRSVRVLNARKLSVCGQFGFRVRKPFGPSAGSS